MPIRHRGWPIVTQTHGIVNGVIIPDRGLPQMQQRSIGHTVRSGHETLQQRQRTHQVTRFRASVSSTRYRFGASIRSRFFGIAATFSGVVIVLAGCSNDSSTPEDRRFANDPTVEQTGSSETPTAPSAPTSESEPTGPIASPSSILRSRGAPDIVYLLHDNTITSVSIETRQSTIASWSATDSQSIVTIDDAPDGSQVAALVVPAEGGASVVIYDAAGTVVTQIDDLIDLTAMRATPVSDGTGGVQTPNFSFTLGWSSLGDQILLGSSDGQLLTIPVAGGDPIRYDDVASRVGMQNARWSPDGRSIGALIRDASDVGRIVVLTPEGSTLSATEVVGRENLPVGFSVEQFSWNVDGTSLFYVVADRTEGEALGGQLFELLLEQNMPVLITTSGRGGPSGTIASFTPSPDGRSIAVVIAISDDQSFDFHSLIVKSLRNGSTYDVPIGSLNAVPTIWWASDGLLWEQPTDAGPMFTLSQQDERQEPLNGGPREGTPVPQATPEPLG